MSLADHVAEPPKLPGNKCFTCHWYSQLDTSDRKFFDDWIDNGYQNKQLLDACRKEGLDVDEQSFSRHVRKCYKKNAS